MVPVDCSYQLKRKKRKKEKEKKEGTFCFICPVTALPVSYRV